MARSLFFISSPFTTQAMIQRNLQKTRNRDLIKALGLASAGGILTAAEVARRKAAEARYQKGLEETMKNFKLPKPSLKDLLKNQKTLPNKNYKEKAT